MNIDIKQKLRFKRVINSIVRDMPIENLDDEGNFESIRSGLKRLEKETEMSIGVEISETY